MDFDQGAVNRVNSTLETPKGVAEMCKELEELYAEGRAEGIEIGEERGRTDEKVNSIKNIMETLGMSVEKAMDALKITVDSRDIYRKMLEK